MTEDQQRNLIIVIVTILLIGGGVYYYNRNRPPQTPPEEITTSPDESGTPPSQGGEETGEPSPPLEGGVPSPSSSGTGAGGGGQNIDLKAKFDATMANASKAFLAGNYTLALKYYNDALLIKKLDVVYSGMFNVYSAQQNWVKAEWAINTALSLNSTYTEYWKWKLTLLDERTNATFTELKVIYNEGLAKGDRRTKINLVTHFAVLAESNGEKGEAIALWEYAKELNPGKAEVYQAEIDRLQGKI